jgi:hypothetical protein
VLTPELMGITLGKPNDIPTHRRYLEIGLELLENASSGYTIVEVKG